MYCFFTPRTFANKHKIINFMFISYKIKIKNIFILLNADFLKSFYFIS